MAKLLIVVLGLALTAAPAWAIRLKDISHVIGVRDNQLLGYGLVVGLHGTGDGINAGFSYQSLVAFLKRNGIVVPGEIRAENIAAVIVTAKLPPFARPGSRIDVTVASVADAKTLQGGQLIMTPLKAGDGKVYAVAQGAVMIGGFQAKSGGTSIVENHPTVGQIPGGALIEREVAIDLSAKSQISFALHNPDFVTAQRVAEAINKTMKGEIAQPIDAGTIGVLTPAEYQGRMVEFIAQLETIPVNPDQPARVVLDERTGTIIMGENVRVSTVAIAHGNLSITITSEESVSQPLPFSQGKTEKTVSTAIQAEKEKRNMVIIPESVTITELVSGLNALGVSPRDLIIVLQSIKAWGRGSGCQSTSSTRSTQSTPKNQKNIGNGNG
ncbi:MAG: flagellar basal body P-ring protein FlgI [Candidatus Sumerlaeota bacterium]|nr:flagellar basal body P-ring protein FlgI [Candidatus Sumerlaeota bacterium]